jgi:hypothetical protein
MSGATCLPADCSVIKHYKNATKCVGLVQGRNVTSIFSPWYNGSWKLLHWPYTTIAHSSDDIVADYNNFKVNFR